MFFYPPFNMPFFYNNNKYYNHHNYSHKRENFKEIKMSDQKHSEQNSKASENTRINESSEAFFEIFGLKIYFDDILIMCILFFLYTEKVHDDELFICLILLLLT